MAATCPDCGSVELIEVRAECPDEKPGCVLLHWDWACRPCTERQRTDRPVTVVEVQKMIDAAVQKLTDAINRGSAAGW